MNGKPDLFHNLPSASAALTKPRVNKPNTSTSPIQHKPTKTYRCDEGRSGSRSDNKYSLHDFENPIGSELVGNPAYTIHNFLVQITPGVWCFPIC